MTDQDRLADIKARMEASFATPTTGPQRDAWMRWIDTMRDDVPWLVGEVERLRGLLRQLEWTATLPVYGDGTEAGCPVCQQPRLPDGHAPTCWLAAELEGERA